MTETSKVMVVVAALVCILVFVITGLSRTPETPVVAESPIVGARASTTLTNPQVFTEGLAIGTTGSATKITGFYTGKCHLFASSSAARVFAASTTLQADCQATRPLASANAAPAALTGVQAGDIVMLHAPTTTPGALLVIGYAASTTSGYIPVTLYNLTGASQTLATTTLNDWEYTVFHR